jgi:acyl carrier protein
MTTTTLERLKTILARDYRADVAQLTPEAPLDSLGVDSLAAVELLWSVEEEFGIKLPTDPPPLTTIGDVVGLIDAYLTSAQEPAPPHYAPAP